MDENEDDLVEGIDFMKQLEGKTIARVRIHGVNCASLETTEGKFYMLATECILPTLSLYGVEMHEVSKEDILDIDSVPDCDQLCTD
jgi:predicted methyltransferase